MSFFGIARRLLPLIPACASVQAEENLGMVMCFVLASDAKEWLDSRRDELAALHDAHIEQTRLEQEEVCINVVPSLPPISKAWRM